MLTITKKNLASYLAVMCVVVSAQASDWLNAGPLFDDFALTLAPGNRAEAVGPLFYYEDKDSQETWAVPPLFSYTHDPITESTEFDFLYPLLTLDKYGPEYRWQLFQLLSFAGGQDPDDTIRSRFTLFPLYFQQRSTDPEKNYTALVPFYGHLQHRLLRDETFFVMFPMYAKTRKADVVTYNYLFPVFSLRYGNSRFGWKFWPLAGAEHKDPTTKTNSFDDTEIIGGHEKFFALWPFFFNNRTGIGTENPEHAQAILPLYYFTRSPKRDATTVIWPFFTYVDDREKKYHEWETPWPLIVFARGEGKTTSRFWPLFSQAHTTNLESAFYLWPVYKYNRVHSGPLDRDRTRILFFLYSDVNEKNLETGTALHRIDFWPLFTHRRDFNGNTRLQILSLLEPILPTSKSIERDYSQIWSVWRAENNPTTGASSQSFLWNLYRHESSPARKKCSLLFGLFQYESSAAGKDLRLFYIPIMKTKTAAGTASAKTK